MQLARGGSQFAVFVHVANDALDGNVADGALEEKRLDGLGGDGPQRRQQQQQLAEPEGLARVGARDVAVQGQLGAVLQHRHRRQVAQHRRAAVES